METPADKKNKGQKEIHHVQLHVALTPLGMPPMLSISTIGQHAMEKITKTEHGLDVIMKTGREFFIPWANVPAIEYKTKIHESK